MVMEEDGADLGKGNGGDNGNKAIFLWNGTQMIETNASREMLGLLYEVPGSMPEDQGELSCESCSEKKAEIFQVTGDYCLHCWQEETHPDV
jgi:hypothetical protein